MSTIDDALLSAYLDGELSGDDLATVEAALASQPAVGRRLATLKLVNELTREHASSIDAVPLPARILALASSETRDPIPSSAKLLPFRRTARAWLPLAASIVLVIGLGFNALQNRMPGSEDAPLHAVHAAQLQTLPSGDTFQGEAFSLTPQFSFISHEGQACRIYRVDETTASHTRIACLNGASWHLVDGISTTVASNDGGYLPATSRDEALEATLDTLMEGAPLSRAQEQALLDNDWQAL